MMSNSSAMGAVLEGAASWECSPTLQPGQLVEMMFNNVIDVGNAICFRWRPVLRLHDFAIGIACG
jgi:hypothetical protein